MFSHCHECVGCMNDWRSNEWVHNAQELVKGIDLVDALGAMSNTFFFFQYVLLFGLAYFMFFSLLIVICCPPHFFFFFWWYLHSMCEWVSEWLNDVWVYGTCMSCFVLFRCYFLYCLFVRQRLCSSRHNGLCNLKNCSLIC